MNVLHQRKQKRRSCVLPLRTTVKSLEVEEDTSAFWQIKQDKSYDERLTRKLKRDNPSPFV